MTGDPEAQPITKSDIVTRALISPKDFSETLAFVSPQLDLNKTFMFQEKNGRKVESVNCMRLLNNDVKKCHDLGLVKLEFYNKRQRENNKPTHTYYGYVSANVECIESFDIKGVCFAVSNEPENDNEAHCHVEMLNFKEAGVTKDDRNRARDFVIRCFDNITKY